MLRLLSRWNSHSFDPKRSAQSTVCLRVPGKVESQPEKAGRYIHKEEVRPGRTEQQTESPWAVPRGERQWFDEVIIYNWWNILNYTVSHANTCLLFASSSRYSMKLFLASKRSSSYVRLNNFCANCATFLVFLVIVSNSYSLLLPPYSWTASKK